MTAEFFSLWSTDTPHLNLVLRCASRTAERLIPVSRRSAEEIARDAAVFTRSYFNLALTMRVDLARDDRRSVGAPVVAVNLPASERGRLDGLPAPTALITAAGGLVALWKLADSLDDEGRWSELTAQLSRTLGRPLGRTPSWADYTIPLPGSQVVVVGENIVMRDGWRVPLGDATTLPVRVEVLGNVADVAELEHAVAGVAGATDTRTSAERIQAALRGR